MMPSYITVVCLYVFPLLPLGMVSVNVYPRVHIDPFRKFRMGICNHQTNYPWALGPFDDL